MDLELNGKVALVTGGSRGIGAAIATGLAREGCAVAFNHWKDADAAANIAGAIGALGRRALAFETDVSVFDDAQTMVRRVVADLGRLDILVCNAGIAADRVLWKMSEDEWDRVLAVNLKGCFNYLRATAGIFKEQRAGKIVNITSINGLRGKFGQANYAASKGGLVALTKSAARDLGRYGINVNAVAPGMVRTEMARQLPDEIVQQAENEAVLGRIADPEDIAGLVTFLCSPGARHITGQCIQVDGGQYI